jgi:LL-diaminopimelate aminotransferase
VTNCFPFRQPSSPTLRPLVERLRQRRGRARGAAHVFFTPLTSSSLDIARLSAGLGSLPPYVFAELDRLKADTRQRGIQFVDLGIGSPDRPTPQPIVDVLQHAASDPATHGYPPFRGVEVYREAVGRFMQHRFGVRIDASSEVLALAGAKEGIAQIIMATAGTDDIVLVPEIYYPVYARASQLAGASVHWVPMRASTDFLADFDAVPHDVLRRARILIVNYPNNPTGAVAEREYFERAVAFAHEHGIILVSDLAYSQLTYDGFVAPSALEVPGAKEVTIEFHSCSKSFNMAGVRVGFAVGAASLIDALAAYRTNVGYGAPSAVQYAAAYAFDHYAELSGPVAAGYRVRRDAVAAAMRRLGEPSEPPRGAMYLWHRVPNGVDDWTFVRTMLEEARVVVTPGSAFGPGGAGYYRLSYVAEPPVLEAAVERISAACAARAWR